MDPPTVPSSRPARQSSLDSNEQIPKVPSSRPKKVISTPLETENVPVIPTSRPSKRVPTNIVADINEAENNMHSLRNDTVKSDDSCIASTHEIPTRNTITKQENNQSEVLSTVSSQIDEEKNDLVKENNIVSDANHDEEKPFENQKEEIVLSSSNEKQNTLTSDSNFKNRTSPDVTEVDVAYNHEHQNDFKADGNTEVERNDADVEYNNDLVNLNKVELELKEPDQKGIDQTSQNVNHNFKDTLKKEIKKANNERGANERLLEEEVDEVTESDEKNEVNVVDGTTERKVDSEKESKETTSEELVNENKSNYAETEIEGNQDETITEFDDERKEVRAIVDDSDIAGMGLVSEITEDYGDDADLDVVASENAENSFSDDRLKTATIPGDDVPLKNITSQQQEPKTTIGNERVENELSESKRIFESNDTVINDVNEKCDNAAPEMPELPKTRPKKVTLQQSLDSTSAKIKAPPPKVPKKPSSKIAAFQEMLQQQQNAELGLSTKNSPKIPWKRPGVASTTDESNLKAGSPDESKKTVNRAQTDFALNLNGLLGVGLPGIALGSNTFEALKHVTKESSEDISIKNKDSPKVSDARRSRARGPRGRKLPEEVKKPVEVNNETLGNTLKVTIQSLWSIDFRDVSGSSDEGKIAVSHIPSDDVESNIISAQLNPSPVDDSTFEHQSEASIENNDSQELAAELLSGENLVTPKLESPIFESDTNSETISKDEKTDYLNTPNNHSDPLLATLYEGSNEPDHVPSENMESLRP